MAPSPGNAAGRGREIASQTALVLGSRVVGALSTGVLTVVLGRALGLSEYSEYAFAMTVATLAAMLATMGIDTAAGRYVAQAHNGGEGIGKVVAASLRLRTMLAAGALVLVLGLAPVISRVVDGNHTRPIQAAAFALLGTLFFTWVGSIIEAVQDGRNLALLSIVKSLVEFAAVMMLLLAGSGVIGAIAGNAVGYAASVLFGFWVIRRYLTRNSDGRPVHETGGREIVRYGAHVWAAGIAWMLFDRIDVVMIAALLNQDAVGLYDMAWRAATILGLLGVSLASTVPPRIAGQPPEIASRVLSNVLRVSLIFYLVVGAITAIAAPRAAALLLGDEFGRSGDILRVLVPYIVLVGMAPIIARSLDYIGGSEIRKWIALIALVINVALDLILIPTVGLMGPAIATNIAIATFVAGHYWAVVRHLPMPTRSLARTGGRAVAGAALGAAACWTVLELPGPPWLTLIAAIVTGLVVAALTILALGEASGRAVSLPRPLDRLLGGVVTTEVKLPSATASMILLGAIGIGLVTGRSPLIAVALTVGLAFMALLLTNVTTGVIVFVLVQPFGMLFGAGETLLTKGGGVLLMVTWLVSLRYPATRGRYARFLHTIPLLGWLMFGFLAWACASILWSLNTADSVDAIQRFALGFVLLVIVFTAAWSDAAMRRICGAFALSVGLTAITGLALGRFTEGRFTGTFQDANEWAAFCIPGILISVGMIATSRKALHQLAFGACATLAAVGLVLSGSRGGMIGVVIALGVWIAFGGRWRLRVAAASVLVAVLGAGYIMVAASPATKERFATITNGQSYGTSAGTGRSDIWKVGTRAYEDHPIVGTGAGTFVDATPRYIAQPGLLRRVDFFTTDVKVAHNMYLHIAVELGAIGAALYISILLACLLATLRAAMIFRALGDTAAEFLCRTLLAGAGGFLAANFFISGQYARDLWILMGMCVGMLGLAQGRRATAHARAARVMAAPRGRRATAPPPPRAAVTGPA
ncbi:MAG: oligosaccharide flippase family protein [Thermoleophilia bacterium]|nr:oligosaccharide flippase family protein [Thermoleophilia bacterium]